MKDCKIYVNGKSAEIQKKLFDMGAWWIDSPHLENSEGSPFLFVSNNIIKMGVNMTVFSNSPLPELTADEILAMQPEPDLKPFDKVLVRNSEVKEWWIDFFSHCDSGKDLPFVCIADAYRQCIPYEGNEALHLTINSPK